MRIIFIKPANSTFIKVDQEILEKEFEVTPFLMNQNINKLVYGLKIVSLFFYLLSFVFRRNVVFVAWFADYHSAIMAFAGKLLRIKTVVFIGGQEAISYPELKKGVYRKVFRGVCVKYALRNSSLIIANHKSLIYHENYYYNSSNPHIDGIKHYVKNLSTKIEIVYNGVDPKRIVRDSKILKQENLILTVGTMSQEGDFYNKGYDLFIQVAARNPLLQFVLIGLNPHYLEWTEMKYCVSSIPNLTIIPLTREVEILNYNYNRAKIFVQASITEGMPNTLSESMLMECIPVGSKVNGIPDAIGSTGIIVNNRSVEDLEKAIYDALKLDTGKQARARVLDMFSQSLREKKLLEIFKSL